MATYMQITSLPFWFMIVSVRIADLPMLLSPITSSLWPRPIGIIESIALIPVWRGSFTGCLSTTPGAVNSTGQKSLFFIGPLLSSGFPSGSITLPDKLFAGRYLQDIACTFHRVAFLYFLKIPKDYCPYFSSVQV